MLVTVCKACADSEIFQKGGGGEDENFKRKMFVDTRINKSLVLSYDILLRALTYVFISLVVR